MASALVVALSCRYVMLCFFIIVYIYLFIYPYDNDDYKCNVSYDYHDNDNHIHSHNHHDDDGGLKQKASATQKVVRTEKKLQEGNIILGKQCNASSQDSRNKEINLLHPPSLYSPLSLLHPY